MSAVSAPKALRQRVIDANLKQIDKTKALFDAFKAERMGFVKVNAPLFEKQESGQWACVGCTCRLGHECPPKNRGKHPVGEGWQHHPTTDWQIVEQWLKDGFNIGLYPLPGCRLLGIDEDVVGALDVLFGEDEAMNVLLTSCADTIGKKFHVFVRFPDGYDIDIVTKGKWTGGDILRDGLVRHFVMPNMLHPEGRRTWNDVTTFQEIDPAVLTRLVGDMEAVLSAQTQAKKPTDPGWEVKEGGRHGFLLTAAAHLRNSGLDEDGIYTALSSLNAKRCVPPKGDDEIRKIARDYSTKESVAEQPKITLNLGHDGSNGNGNGTLPPTSHLRTIASYTARHVDWLWEGWMPRAEPVILEGLGGEGKSTFVVDLMARLSQGRDLPGGVTNPFGAPMDSIYITGEDDPERVLKPRFLAASGGADLDRIHFWQSQFTIPEDLQALADAIKSRPAARLVFIDPLFSHVDATLNTGSDSEVRKQIMNPLREIAHALDVTVLIARHLNKKGGDDPALRGSGSYGGLTGAARAVLQSIGDPEDEDRQRKVIGVIKANYGKMPKPWVYQLEGVTVHENGEDISTSRIAYLYPHDKFIDQIVEAGRSKAKSSGSSAQEKRDSADADLIDILSPGELEAPLVMQEMLGRGHSRDMTYGAKARCHVEAYRPGGNTGPYVWRLPGHKPGRQGRFTYDLP